MDRITPSSFPQRPYPYRYPVQQASSSNNVHVKPDNGLVSNCFKNLGVNRYKVHDAHTCKLLRDELREEKAIRVQCEKKEALLVEMISVLHAQFGQLVKGLLGKGKKECDETGYYLNIGPFQLNEFLQFSNLLESLPGHLMGDDEHLGRTRSKLARLNELLMDNPVCGQFSNDNRNGKNDEPVASTSRDMKPYQDFKEIVSPQTPKSAGPLPKRRFTNRMNVVVKAARMQTSGPRKMEKTMECENCLKRYTYYPWFLKHCRECQSFSAQRSPAPVLKSEENVDNQVLPDSIENKASGQLRPLPGLQLLSRKLRFLNDPKYEHNYCMMNMKK